MRVPHSLALIAGLVAITQLVCGRAARALDVAAALNMPDVSLETLHQLRESDRGHSSASVDEILSQFLVEKRAIWHRLSDELQLSNREDAPVTDDEIRKLEVYIGWYTNLAKAFSRRMINFDQAQMLVAHYQEMQVARTLLNFSDSEEDNKKNSSLWLSISTQEKQVLKELQSRNLHRMRGEAIDMLVEGDPEQQMTLRQALRNLSPTIASSTKELLPHTPENYQWLWGLGDLMMESGDLRQHISPSENALTFSVDSLFDLYLNQYLSAVNSLVKRRDSVADLSVRSFNNHSLRWVYVTLLSPLAHMASLSESAPASSVRAESLLADFRQRTQSPTLAERSQTLLEQVQSARELSCERLVRKAGGITSPGDLEP
ncbi:MAG TPA: hypothetical protein VM901_00540 [Bdellovibrionota bacterium]|jgi:hypothetical protein|nr:hypothetical protein [Bdellovibrionota bacterium]